MSPVAGVLCAVTGPLEAALVRAIGDSARLEVTRRCADVAELLAAAAAGLGRAAVVSAGLPGLDRAAVEHLRTSGVRVLALADADWPLDRVRHLGVDAVASQDDAVDAIVAEVQRMLAGERGPRVGAGAGSPVPPDDDSPAGTVRDDAGLPDRGRLVAVWGPTGAPGRSTVALTLAHELAEMTRRKGAGPVLVVDADTYGGAVAQLLGMLDEAPGIAAAARAAATGRLDGVGLAALTPVLANGLRVLTGISRAARWPELPAAHLSEIGRASCRERV